MKKSKKTIIALSAALVLALGAIAGYIISYMGKEPVVDEKELFCNMENRLMFCKDKNFKPFSGIAINKRSNGTLIRYYHYKDGKREGEAKLYYPDGELEAHQIFKNGTMNSSESYTKNGQLVSKMTIKGNEWGIVAYYENGKIALSYLATIPEFTVKNRACYDRQGETADCEKVHDDISKILKDGGYAPRAF